MRPPVVPRDRIGLGCMRCDPVVRATTYGSKLDPFVRVVDSLNADGSISRMVITRGYVPTVGVRVGFVK